MDNEKTKREGAKEIEKMLADVECELYYFKDNASKVEGYSLSPEELETIVYVHSMVDLALRTMHFYNEEAQHEEKN